MRTAVCPICGRKKLKWATNSLGMRYLVEFDSGVEHYKKCPGVVVPTGQPEPESGDDAAEQQQPASGQQQQSAQQQPSPSDAAESGDESGEQQPGNGEPIPANESASPAIQPIAQPEPEPVAEPEQESSDHEHKMQRELDRLVKIRPALNIMLVGPAGGGKTTACRIAAERAGLAYSERSMGPATSQWDLLGFVSPTTGNYVPGILRGPFENGGVLALDEVDNSNPSVPTAWNSALANGHFTFPDNIEVAKHPEFVCVACANTYGRGADRLYVGRQQLDAATLDRFVVMEWDYDERAELDWAGADDIAREWVPFVQRVRARATALKMRVVISPRASIYGARMLRARIRPQAC